MAAWVSARQGKKISETHKQVSENSHRNAKPTILDVLSDVQAEQRRTNALIVNHIAWHLQGDKE